MGRVSRYKKVKSIDPFAKNGSWKSDVGDCSTFRRVKKKSKTAIKMKEQKLNKLQRRMRGGNKNGNIIDRKKSGGCNGYGDDDGYDLPPEGEDEFDLKDILGSIKKQKSKPNPLLDGVVANKMSDQQIESLKTSLDEILGKKTKLSIEIDSSLIGGIKLRIDNTFLDASIHNQLQILRTELLQT